MSQRTLLIVDDDRPLRERLSAAFRERGYFVFEAADHKAAIEVAHRQRIDRAIVDLRMPGPHGLVVVRDLIELHGDIEIIVLTGYGSIVTAVEAMQLGARNYLTKPANADQINAAFDVEPNAESDIPLEIPSIASVEREHIERVLLACKGNISKAARVLGMHRRTLQYKLAKFPMKR